MCFLIGCCKSDDSNKNYSAEKNVIVEIQQTLDQNDIQVLIAFGDNFEAKMSLLQSLELHSDGLIALCTNPKPMNLWNNKVRKLFKEAIERTELTAEQKVKIAKSKIEGMGLY